MHHKHPSRMPGRDFIPGPDGRRVRHTWAWDTRRDMTGEKRYRLFQAIGWEPLALQRVKRFGEGFVMLPAPKTTARGEATEAIPTTYVGHMRICPQCATGKPCRFAQVEYGAV